MIITGNTDAHLKNWAFWYPDGVQPRLSPVYDFHSLTIYQNFKYNPLALSLAGEQMPSYVTIDHFRRLAEACGSDPEAVGRRVTETVERLREAWKDGLRGEAQRLFPALAEHYDRRLTQLPLTGGEA